MSYYVFPLRLRITPIDGGPMDPEQMEIIEEEVWCSNEFVGGTKPFDLAKLKQRLASCERPAKAVCESDA